MKKVLLFAFGMLVFGSLSAQEELNPVKWTYQAVKVADGEFDLVFKPAITDGWYVYSQYLESEDGPIPTSFHFEDNAAVQLVGKVEEGGEKHEGFDDLFQMNVVKFSGQPTFTQRVKISGEAKITGYVEYMTCDETRCLPPTEVDFRFSLN